MCHVGVSNEGRSGPTAIGQSNDCKWMFNEASLGVVPGGSPFWGVKEPFFSLFSG